MATENILPPEDWIKHYVLDACSHDENCRWCVSDAEELR